MTNKEFAFDLTLMSVARVHAATEEEARQKLNEVVEAVDLNFEQDGVKLTEASIYDKDEIELFEVDGADQTALPRFNITFNDSAYSSEELDLTFSAAEAAGFTQTAIAEGTLPAGVLAVVGGTVCAESKDDGEWKLSVSVVLTIECADEAAARDFDPPEDLITRITDAMGTGFDLERNWEVLDVDAIEAPPINTKDRRINALRWVLHQAADITSENHHGLSESEADTEIGDLEFLATLVDDEDLNKKLAAIRAEHVEQYA